MNDKRYVKSGLIGLLCIGIGGCSAIPMSRSQATQQIKEEVPFVKSIWVLEFRWIGWITKGSESVQLSILLTPLIFERENARFRSGVLHFQPRFSSSKIGGPPSLTARLASAVRAGRTRWGNSIREQFRANPCLIMGEFSSPTHPDRANPSLNRADSPWSRWPNAAPFGNGFSGAPGR